VERTVGVTEREISWSLSQSWSPFYYCRQWCSVRNVSWGFGLDYEADLLVCSRAGVLTEIEIKTSVQDWKNDAKKRKHRFGDQRIRRFYYAAPLKLAERHGEFWSPPGAGIVGLRTEEEFKENKPRVVVLKRAALRQRQSIDAEDMARLARLGSMRAWDKP